MDELKLKLSTKFMRNIIARFISKSIFKKTGYKIDIQLNEIEIKIEDGKIKLHTNVDIEADNDDFVDIVKTIKFD